MSCRRKTRPGRLERLDALLVALEPELLTGPGTVVDLGLGARPWTTLEWAETLVPRGVEVVGVDHAPDLVERARADHARDGVRYAVGSFDLPAHGVRLVRAMNVLRDFGPDDVVPAHARMGASLVEGGLLVEGSCGPEGEVGCVHLVRRRGDAMVREGVLMWLDGAKGTAPLLFRDRLPRDLRDAQRDGHPIREVLLAWMAAYRTLPVGPERLAQAAEGIPGLRMIGLEAALWAPEGGVA